MRLLMVKDNILGTQIFKNNGALLILQMIQHRQHSTWTMVISVQMQTDYIMQINAIKHII